MEMSDVALGWVDESVPIHTHACYYYSDEATLRTSLHFLKAGLHSPDDLLVVFCDRGRFGQFREWLEADFSRPVDELVESGKPVFIGGEPTMDELVASIGRRLDAGITAGYKLIRFLGFIAWGEPGWPDDRTLLEFESKVNEVVMAYPAVIICTYGVPTLGGSRLIYGGLQTHPIVWLSGTKTASNPFYVPPVATPSH